MMFGLRTVAVPIVGSANSVGSARVALKNAGDVALVEKGRVRWVIMRCPCGCGDDVFINVDPEQGPSWRLRRDEAGITLFPSVWRDSGCGSHYIVRKGRAYLFTSSEHRLDWDQPEEATLEKVLGMLSDREVDFLTISEHAGIDPWEALAVCRVLVERGRVTEGVGVLRGWFTRA
ncbi:MAG: DUF6527 family protein [Myxococcota bacterium]